MAEKTTIKVPEGYTGLVEDLREIILDEDNPNETTDQEKEAIWESLTQFGWVYPIIVDEKGVMGDGEQRLTVALEHDEFYGPVLRLEDLDDTQRRLLRQVLNTLKGTHDFRKDALEFERIIAAGRGQTLRNLILVSEANLRKHLDSLRKEPKPEKQFKPLDQYTTDIVKGDRFQLGDHILMCGSSADPQDVRMLLGDEKVDLVFTSPPYNVNLDYVEVTDDMDPKDYLALIQDVAALCYQHMGDGRFLAWNLGVRKPTQHYRQACIIEDLGFKYFRQIIWKKPGISFPIFNHTLNNPEVGNYAPNYVHEVIWLFTKGDVEKRGTADVDMKYQYDVWEISAAAATKDIPTVAEPKTLQTKDGRGKLDSRMPHAQKIHPAVYPRSIPEGGIKFLTAEGEIVYDPFAGTGTTMIAAHDLNRRARLMELTPLYCQVTIDRWESYTGNKAIKIV